MTTSPATAPTRATRIHISLTGGPTRTIQPFAVTTANNSSAVPANSAAHSRQCHPLEGLVVVAILTSLGRHGGASMSHLSLGRPA
jgi:hypothetical protein